MSFHGGLLGVIVAILAFSLRNKHLDRSCCPTWWRS